MSHEIILLYDSEHFGPRLPLVLGTETGREMHWGWLHQDVKLTVNKVIYTGCCGCCFKRAHNTLARNAAEDDRVLPEGSCSVSLPELLGSGHSRSQMTVTLKVLLKGHLNLWDEPFTPTGRTQH